MFLLYNLVALVGHKILFGCVAVMLIYVLEYTINIAYRYDKMLNWDCNRVAIPEH